MKVKIDKQIVGFNILKKIRENSYTVEEVAKITGISIIAIENWVSGKYIPSLEHLVELAYLFNTTIDELLGEVRVIK